MDLFRQIFLDWSKSELIDEWKILARYSRIFSTVNFCIVVSAIFSYWPDLIHIYITQPANQRRMLLKAAYPFDYLNSPTYEIITIIQEIQGGTLALIDSVIQTLFVTLVS